jgi:hypothetical protein
VLPTLGPLKGLQIRAQFFIWKNLKQTVWKKHKSVYLDLEKIWFGKKGENEANFLMTTLTYFVIFFIYVMA